MKIMICKVVYGDLPDNFLLVLFGAAPFAYTGQTVCMVTVGKEAKLSVFGWHLLQDELETYTALDLFTVLEGKGFFHALFVLR